MNSGYYTGIGSRDTPLDVRRLMTEIAMHMQGWGYTVRTGVASAADRAFETGAGSMKEVYVPWDGWNEQRGISSVTPASLTLARQVWEHRRKTAWDGLILETAHVAEKWEEIHPATQMLLAKTMCMILGRNLDRPSDTLICWSPSCRVIGISAHPIVLATISNIPVFNLADPETEDVIRAMLRENRDPSDTITNRRSRCERGTEIFGVSLV